MYSSHKDYKQIFKSKMKVKHYTGHRKKVSTLDWNSNGEQLASASHDGTIRLWSLDNSGLTKRTSFKAHDDIIEEVKWNPVNENILASASTDAIMKIWDTRVG